MLLCVCVRHHAWFAYRIVGKISSLSASMNRREVAEQEHLTALDEFLPLCQEQRIGVMLGGPYYAGILASDLTPEDYDLFLSQRPNGLEILNQAQRLKVICDRHGVPLKAAALQFGLGHPAVATTLTACQTPEEIEENLSMISRPVPASLWSDLKAEKLIPEQAPTHPWLTDSSPGALQRGQTEKHQTGG